MGIERIAAVLSNDAEALKSVKPVDRAAIVFGNEASGLDEATIGACDRKVTIPMKRGTDSLNVAVAAAVFLLGAFVPSHTPIRFEDIAGSAGIQFTTENCPTPEKHQPETMPAGVALFDYDGDGLLDIYVVNGAQMPSLVKTEPKYNNRLFHNNGHGSFTDVTERAGVAGAGWHRHSRAPLGPG